MENQLMKLGEEEKINYQKSDSIIKVLFHKYAFRFWIILTGTILSAIAVLGYETPQRRTLEDIIQKQHSLFPVFDLGSDFYIFFRLFIFCICIFFGFLKYKEGDLNIIFVFIVMGIIFNPILPFHFNNNLSTILEFFSAGIFAYLAYEEYQKTKMLINKK